MQININYYGLSCFGIEAKAGNSVINVVIDPYKAEGTGLRLPRNLSCDILAINPNSDLYNNTDAVAKAELTIKEPGEYEKGGIFVYGIAIRNEESKKKDIIFRCEFDDISLVHLGGLSRKLTEEELAEMENVDILLLPVGGGDVLDAKKAAEIANQIEPRVIIPMQYEMPGLDIKLDAVGKFLKEYGAKEETMSKLKVARKDLPQEDVKVIVLERG